MDHNPPSGGRVATSWRRRGLAQVLNADARSNARRGLERARLRAEGRRVVKPVMPGASAAGRSAVDDLMRIPVRIGPSRWTRSALALLSLTGLQGFAPASELAAARTACIPSVLRLCPAAALAGDHDGAKRCLLKNLQKASAQCQAAVRAIPPESGVTARSS